MIWLVFCIFTVQCSQELFRKLYFCHFGCLLPLLFKLVQSTENSKRRQFQVLCSQFGRQVRTEFRIRLIGEQDGSLVYVLADVDVLEVYRIWVRLCGVTAHTN